MTWGIGISDHPMAIGVFSEQKNGTNSEGSLRSVISVVFEYNN
jgi:hypothetical protein